MDDSRLGMVRLNEGPAKGYDNPLAHMAMPKPTLHWIHLQQRMEEEMGLLQ